MLSDIHLIYTQDSQTDNLLPRAFFDTITTQQVNLLPQGVVRYICVMLQIFAV